MLLNDGHKISKYALPWKVAGKFIYPCMFRNVGSGSPVTSALFPYHVYDHLVSGVGRERDTKS